jgi:Flp pilus assembly protein TadD
MLKTFAAGLMMLTSGCVTTMTQASATEQAICEAWGGSLPTRSRSDTQQTQDEIQQAYAVQDAVCLN